MRPSRRVVVADELDVRVARTGDDAVGARAGEATNLNNLGRVAFYQGDFAAARACKPGDCGIKLSRSAMEHIRAEIDWNAPDARARASSLMKQMLVEYTAAYM
jgi:hypothetical protein